MLIPRDGCRGNHEPDKSEYTVCAIEFYNGIAAYLSELQNTSIRSIEDIIAFNNEHPSLEGASPGDHPAFRKNDFSAFSFLFRHFGMSLRHGSAPASCREMSYYHVYNQSKS